MAHLNPLISDLALILGVAGIITLLFKKLKQAWSNWLNRMASQNKAAFGSETLDCCRVGRENHKATPHN